MKNQIIKSIIISISILAFNINSTAQCVQCDANSSASGNYSSVLGMSANATGQASLAAGLEVNANSNYSFAQGKFVTVDGASSMAIGRYLETDASPAMIIGAGVGSSSSEKLYNDISYSLMIGFNSNKPTLFVGMSDGLGYTGSIGIGDVTNPQAKLHIKADASENVDLILEPGGSGNYAFLKFGVDPFGTSANRIEAKTDSDMKFHTASDFVFWDANVGIGTNSPTEKLEVLGTVKATALVGDGSGLTNLDDDDWIVSGNNVYRLNGNVGIGTDAPQTRLHIEDNTGNLDAEFLKISNDDVLAGGTTTIGKDAGNGPLFLQKAGSFNFGDVGPRPSIKQAANNGEIGLDLSTFTNLNGEVWYSSIEAPNSNLYILSTNDIVFTTDYSESEHVVFKQNGKVGIGIDPGPDSEKLEVAGNIKAETVIADILDIDDFDIDELWVNVKLWAGEIEVTNPTQWKDCVFKDDYKLRTLQETEKYIIENGHLPDIPSEAEVLENGINVGEMNALLLQKIEELTLYVIELEKKIEKTY